jgi:hypothetical protein
MLLCCVANNRITSLEKILSALQSQCRSEESRQDARSEGLCVTRELNVLALFKGEERYIFVYDEESREALINDIRHKAADPTITLNWFDASILTERIRSCENSPQEEF